MIQVLPNEVMGSYFFDALKLSTMATPPCFPLPSVLRSTIPIKTCIDGERRLSPFDRYRWGLVASPVAEDIARRRFDCFASCRKY